MAISFAFQLPTSICLGYVPEQLKLQEDTGRDLRLMYNSILQHIAQRFRHDLMTRSP